MKVLLLQLDGHLPNLALLRLTAHHRALGDSVSLQQCRTIDAAERGLWDQWDIVYASLIFTRSRPIAERLKSVYPGCIAGGTGWDLETTLEQRGVGFACDYSLYPSFRSSIGFTQRGCRMSYPGSPCHDFCVVPRKEGRMHGLMSIAEIWRGKPWPRELIILDNDFFGNREWPDRIKEIREGGFKVNFTQGFNARLLSERAAAAVATVDYRSTNMRDKKLYCAWDNIGDEAPLFRGLEALVRHGIPPGHISVYMLIGLHDTAEDREYRREKLRAFGVDPYPMPFVRTKELVGFQRWCVGHYDKRISWDRWVKAKYQPANLGNGERSFW